MASSARILKNVFSQQMYQTQFIGKAYAKKYLSPNSQYELKSFPEEFLHRMFHQGLLPGKKLLDVGSGPSVRSIVSASAHINEIYLSDLVEDNRKEILKWLDKKDDAFDCSWIFKLVAGFEKIRDSNILEARVRQAVKGVLSCDVLQHNPLHPNTSQFDVVTTCECLDSMIDHKDYFQAVKNVSRLVRKGGRLALISSLGCSRYQVGNVEFPAANVDPSIAKRAFQESGLLLIVMEERYYGTQSKTGSDTVGMFATVCEKI